MSIIKRLFPLAVGRGSAGPTTCCYGLAYPLMKCGLCDFMTNGWPNYLVRSGICPYIWAINEQRHAMNHTSRYPEMNGTHTANAICARVERLSNATGNP